MAERSAAEQAAAQSAAAQSSAAQAAAEAAAQQAAAEQAAADQAAADQAAADRLAAAFARAAELQDAAAAAGWTGPICNSDSNLHREQAGQSPLSDDEWAEECEVSIAQAEAVIADQPVETAGSEGWITPNGNWVSPETAERAIAAGITPGDTVPNYLRCGTICGEGPTSGEVQFAHACLDGTMSAQECEGIDPEAIIEAAEGYGG